jgi:hypothetical protein
MALQTAEYRQRLAGACEPARPVFARSGEPAIAAANWSVLGATSASSAPPTRGALDVLHDAHGNVYRIAQPLEVADVPARGFVGAFT